ncbi:hypothetical protein C8R42DRAFT_353711 [Lentinula raphanica]|nr:hypothetical protein C8R42DRAFT_353711 [Lentinula raphanica]
MHLSTACLMTVALGLLSIVKSMPVQEITNGMSSNRQNPSASQQDPPGQLSGADHMESPSPGPYLSTSTPLLIKRGALVSSQRGQRTSNSQAQAPSAESPPLSPPPSSPPPSPLSAPSPPHSYADNEDNEVDQDPPPDYGSALRDRPRYYERTHLRQGRTSLYTPDPAPDGSRLSTGVQRSEQHEWTGREPALQTLTETMRECWRIFIPMILELMRIWNSFETLVCQGPQAKL